MSVKSNLYFQIKLATMIYVVTPFEYKTEPPSTMKIKQKKDELNCYFMFLCRYKGNFHFKNDKKSNIY